MDAQLPPPMITHRREDRRRSLRVPARVRRRVVLWTSVGIGTVLLIATHLAPPRLHPCDAEQVVATQEHRLLALDCTPERRLMYPEDQIIQQPYKSSPRRGLVFIHCIIIGYMLLGLNTVCDVYFTGSLDVMVDTWKVKPDVAGATFMAAGGSAPEFFTSLIGATITTNDVGFSTIVGSAVFNVLFVIGLCGFAASEPIALSWFPLFRDCSYYIIGLALLSVFCRDDRIAVHEAVILFIAYIVYCVFMYHNDTFEALAMKRGKQNTTIAPAPDPEAPEIKVKDAEDCGAAQNGTGNGLRAAGAEPECVPAAPEVAGGGNPQPTRGSIDRLPIQKGKWQRSLSGRFVEPPKNKGVPGNETGVSPMGSPREGKDHTMVFVGQAKRQQDIVDDSPEPETCMKKPSEDEEKPPETTSKEEEQQEAEEEDDEDDVEALMTMPDNPKDRVLWVLSLPVYVPLYYTLPKPGEKLFMATFGLSLIWIAAYAVVLVWMVEILGEVCHIPDVLMGFTLLAAGTSIPDAVSSVAVAKMGEGDMAISSSIGSNIFDILVGLPIPWMIKIGFVEGIGKGKGSKFQVEILSPFLVFYVLLLLFMVLSVILSIHFLGWKLNKPLGVAMAALYVIFLVTACVVEFLEPEGLKMGK